MALLHFSSFLVLILRDEGELDMDRTEEEDCQPAVRTSANEILHTYLYIQSTRTWGDGRERKRRENQGERGRERKWKKLSLPFVN